MKTLYFDCFAGASGDMILGALIAAGVEPEAFKQQLSLLGVQGYAIDFETVDRSGISATYARVQTVPEHAHRHLSDILRIIYDSRLSDPVKERAAKIFTRLAEAEARVHNQAIEQIHFHEVGALDAIIDVVGAAICFELLGIERFVSSALHVGSGTVEMAHGRFPVPPPAVTELLKGVPFYSTDLKGELLTPTGAAIITTVCNEYGPIPQMRVEYTGYGAGTREYEKFPNVLRVMIGEVDSGGVTDEKLWMIETNLDDVSSQILGYVMERAFDLGARDCYFTSVQMKKNRPGTLLTVVARPELRTTLSDIVFRETTTIGLRHHEVDRDVLQREIVRVDTAVGAVRFKLAWREGRVVNAVPEFEDIQAIARTRNLSVKDVQALALHAYGTQQPTPTTQS